MIASQDEEVFGIFDLVCKEEADSFQRLLSSVYVVAEKQVIGFWRKPAVLEESEKVVILAVNVTFTGKKGGAGVKTHKRFGFRDFFEIQNIPQIFIGASNSSRIGWFMKISRAFAQRYLISYSASCTGFPGRLPRTTGDKGKTSAEDNQRRPHT